MKSIEQHIKIAYVFANSLWDKAALVSMLKGSIPYDKDFCDKFYKDYEPKKAKGA